MKWRRKTKISSDELLTKFGTTANKKSSRSLSPPILRSTLLHLTSRSREYKAQSNFIQISERHFPDIHFTIDTMIAEGDKVVTQWTARGTHKGIFKGIPATGKKVTITAIDIDRIVNGKSTQCWTEDG